MADAYALTDDDLVRMEHRARKFSGAWTGTSGTLAAAGTSGTLAADVMRLLAERRRLLEELARAKEHRCRRGDDPNRPWYSYFELP
jgi:hypothetical protein